MRPSQTVRPTARRVPSGHRTRPRASVRSRVHGTFILFAVLGGIYGLALPSVAGVDVYAQAAGTPTQPAVAATR